MMRSASPFAVRFLAAYFALYFPLLPIERLPVLGALTARYNDLPTGALAWVSEHVFHAPLPFLPWTSSRIDYVGGYERATVLSIAALVIAAAWSARGPRKDDERVGEWLHVWLRYALAGALFHYGASKVSLSQFPHLTPEKLVEPFGDASPMGLLWTFMGYSDGYSVLTGSVECLAGLLLLFRSTATAGGLLGIAAMSNVLALNLCYDVPVKLYSFHLLVMSGLIVAPDARRLTDVLLLQRPVAARVLRPHVAPERTAARAAAAAKWAVVALALYGAASEGVGNWQAVHAPRSPLYGIYSVERFMRDGALVPPLSTDATRWRRVTVSGGIDAPTVSVWSMTDVRESFAAVDDAEHRALVLRSSKGHESRWEYTPMGRNLHLRGTLDGTPVEVELARVDEGKLLLVSRGFHWASERMVNQ
jgi:hypothetical protein